MALIVETYFLEDIIRHCKEAFPVEACGILVGNVDGDARIVKRVYRTRNVLNSSSAYRMDPEEQYKVFEQAEKESMDVLGFYHSHPYWPAKVSSIDKELAFYPSFYYLIYSVSEDNFGLYVLKEGGFEEEALRIV
jgi:proteasome lid subunit RPN8/RPN11